MKKNEKWKVLKMNKRYILYIVIAIVCIIAIIAGVYYQIYGDKPKQNTVKQNEIIDTPDPDEAIDPEILKEEFNSLFDNSFNDQGYDTSSIQKPEQYQEQDVIYAAYKFQAEKDEIYDVDINIPVFNVEGEVADGFNETTQTIFANKANDVLTSNDKYTIYNVEYVAYLNENILSLVIKSTLKEGNSPQRIIVQTYNYDIETKQKLTLNDVLEAKNISTREVNKKIEVQVKEANKQAEAIESALAQSGQTVYKRDINNAMYVTDNVNHFFIGLDGQIYIIYPYGNSNFTSEMDIIKI